jgi:Immunity protein 74
MVLKKVDNSTVRGTWFTVRVLGIHHVEYSEGGRVATVEIEGEQEVPDGEVTWVVYLHTITGWLPPHEYDEMDHAKVEEIAERIGKSLLLLGMPHEIIRAW